MCLLGPEHWFFEKSPKIHHGETQFWGVQTSFFIRNTQNMGFPMINFWAPFKKSMFRTHSTQNSLWISSTQICRYVQFWCLNWPDYILVYTFCLLLILFLSLLRRRCKDEYLGRIRESASPGRPSSCYFHSCCITNIVVWSLCECRARLRTILVVVSLFKDVTLVSYTFSTHPSYRENAFQWKAFSL